MLYFTSSRFFVSFLTMTTLVTSLFGQAPRQPTLGHRGVKTINSRNLLFKDLNKNGRLDPYEDWRLPIERRVEDLLGKMTLEEKVGFMLISTSRMKNERTFQGGGGNAQPISSDFNEEDLVQEINMFSRERLPAPMLSASGTTRGIQQLHLRHFILRANTSPRTIAVWANNIQEACEKSRLGIPAIIASNPRNHITADASVGLSVGTTPFSKWPGELGLAAMNDLALTRAFAETAREEWTSVGLRKAYMYMADLATEPRWQRIEGTFGENGDWAAKMMREIVLGFQGNTLSSSSVALTTKHFPGGGPQVRGLDPHFVWGKEQHYPGNNFDYHLKPFQAAIEAGTSSIMPYYAQPIHPSYPSLAFAYNKAIITDLLRGKMGFKGIVNSDTGPIEMMPWGVEDLSILQRYQLSLQAGVDLFSGSADPSALLEVVRTGLVTEQRINESVRRLLREKFELGLFENPYVDPDLAEKKVGNETFQKRADEAQRKSIVLLRNQEQLLPLKPRTKVYLEIHKGQANTPTQVTPFVPTQNTWEITWVKSKEEADVVVLWLLPSMGSLFSSKPDQEIELQLSKNGINVGQINETTYHTPTVVVVNFTNPWVLDEIDNPNVKGLIATFGTTSDALLDILTGKVKPTGKMPISIPKSRKAVLENASDVPGYLKANYALFKFGDGLSYP